jgi:alpha-galactosidase
MPADDRATLSDHISLWKRMRDVLATGDLHQWATDDGADARMALARDGSEAWLLACRAGVAPHAISAPLRIPGLDDGALYRVVLLAPWPRHAARKLADPETWRAGRVLSGAALARSGLALPLADPETAWLVRLERVQ